ncbi:hypothetical protein Tco_0706216 [Tanacetum coccineum]|uniref:Uncharacterized protein n=1 Tax=Tanacetum coccineum TaxID=301880 RepID=A0ABQ4Y8R6_9ASTR
MKVKKLEHKVKTSQVRRRVKIVISDDKDNQEDPSKQGRKIAQIYEDEGITLVQMSAQTQGRHEHDFEEPDFEFTAPEEGSTASPKVRTAAKSLVYIRRSAAKRKDKGKAIMKEAEPHTDNIQAQIEADEELAHSIWEYQQLQQLRGYSFDEIKVLFEATVKRVNTFTPMKSDDTIPKVVAGSSKRSTEDEHGEESSKRQKIGEGSEPAKESKDKESDKLSQEQLQ